MLIGISEAIAFIDFVFTMSKVGVSRVIFVKNKCKLFPLIILEFSLQGFYISYAYWPCFGEEMTPIDCFQ